MDVLVVAHNQAKELKKILNEKSLYENKWLAKNLQDDMVALPVKMNIYEVIIDVLELNGIPLDIQKMDLQLNIKKEFSNPLSKLRNELLNLQLWNDQLLLDFPKSFEKFQDLLLLNNDSFQTNIWQSKDLWTLVASSFNCKRIARKSAISKDLFRSPRVTMILGDSGLVEHKDNGIKYRYNITKCMFSPGNITEKLRVARFDCSAETVVDLYAGRRNCIGYFTLPYLVHAKAKMVYACEWNPNAVQALKENLKLNEVSDKCIVLEGDNKLTCPLHVADRINLGLIPSSEEGWLPACRSLRKDVGGRMHVHGNVTSKRSGDKKNSDDVNHKMPAIENSSRRYSTESDEIHPNFHKKVHRRVWDEWANQVSERMKAILEEIDEQKWNVSVVHVEHVKSYAPHVNHVVVDIECRPMEHSL